MEKYWAKCVVVNGEYPKNAILNTEEYRKYKFFSKLFLIFTEKSLCF